MMDCGQIDVNFMGQLRTWAKDNSIPISMTFELTPFCNFSCVMCYVHLTKEKAEKQGRLLSAREWLEIARQAKEMGTLEISLTGGEPFTHPEFWEIYSQLNKMGFLISILSNGSLIDESVMEKFHEYGMPYRMKITVYGASDETYSRVCGVSDGFTKTSNAIDLLKAAGVPLQLTATIVRENADDLQRIYAFAKEKQLSMEHTISVVKSARDSVNTVEKSRFSLCDFSEDFTLEDFEKSKYPPHETPFAWCASYKTSLWITWHGRVQLCAFMNTPFVEFSGDLKSDCDTLNKKLNAIKSPAECDGCEWKIFCQRCPGILCAESGHPEKTAPGLCNVAKRLYEIYNKKVESANEKEICNS